MCLMYDLTAEISELEKQRDELEAQLKKVPYPETSMEDFIFLLFFPVSYYFVKVKHLF